MPDPVGQQMETTVGKKYGRFGMWVNGRSGRDSTV